MRDSLGLSRTIADPNLFEEWDHFTPAGVTSGTIGDLGWVETNSAAGTNTKQAGGVTHPGVIRLVTGATSGNNKRIHLGSTVTDANFDPTLFDRFRWVVRIPTITTITVRVGLFQDASSVGTAGAWFEFDPNVAATWTANTRQASASTGSAVGGTVVANNWYLLEARREPSQWVFSVNGTAVVITATLPTTALGIGAFVSTGAAAARNLDLDYVYIRSVLGQLWT